MTDPGRMRHLLTVEQFNGRRDATGDPRQDLDENWTPFCTRWCSVDPISGREFLAAGQETAEVTHKIRCRYKAGIQTDMRLRWGSRIFEIVPPILDKEERHEELLIMAKELVK